MAVKAAFWLSVLLVTYTYLGYPALLWIRSRYAARPWRRAAITPSISIILAVKNGAPLILRQAEHLLNIDYPSRLTEVIIVSDGSTDGTDEILNTIRNPRLHVFRQNSQGKAVALNLGMRHARNEILVFVDIRPQLAKGSLRRIVRNFADPRVGCVAGELRLVKDDHDIRVAAVGDLYWRYERWLRKCESAFDSPCGVYGGYYAVRKDLAVEFPLGTILDDMFQPLSIRRKGYRSVLDSSAIVWDSWPKTPGGEFERKVRTLAGNMQLIQLAPWLLSYGNPLFWQFVSHKLLRLVVPVALLVSFGSSLALGHRTFFLLAAIAQAIFYTSAAVGFLVPRNPLKFITGPASSFSLLNIAAVVGIANFFWYRNEIFKIWIVTRPANVRPAADVETGNFASKSTPCQ
jgi:cellulose synthase/poly-beta-1,6-N-acetylglucosamine synthase-like glycosyltransferase